jgi:hypothetical protein
MAVFDRVAAVLLALALLILGILVPVEIVHTVVGRPGHLVLPWEALTGFFTGHDWSTAPLLTISAVTAGVGLVLLLAEFKRRRPGLLTLRTDDEYLTAGTTRRSLRRALAAQAEEVDSISGATVKVSRRRATVTATTPLHDPGDLREELTQRVTRWLDSLGLVSSPSLRVRLRTREDR